MICWGCAMTEAPEQAARRLLARQWREGDTITLHTYASATGEPSHWAVRLRHTDGSKDMRPMHRNGTGYRQGLPSAPEQGRILYRLPELLAADPAAPVFIVEGESCADALHALGIIATTSGSASSADGADWSPLQGRRAVLWPDNDAPGSKYAGAVAGHLRALGCDVSQVSRDVVEALPEHGDVVDWLHSNPNAIADDVLALPTAATPAPLATAPEPLRRPTPPPEPYPMAELGPLLAPAAESLRRVIQAPDAVCGASLLAAASLATQALADVLIDGRTRPLSLWLLTVAESGERKSAVDDEAMRAAREFEKELASNHRQQLAEHENAMAEWKTARDDAQAKSKKSGGNGLAEALRAIGPAPPAPLTPHVLAADFTAEGLAKLLAAGWPSMGAFTDEAALVFGGHGMSKETVMRTAATLSKLWDAGTLDRVRALDGASKLCGRRLALHLMAQPIIAERALSDAVLAGQGFLPRCLLAWPEGTAGTRPYRAESLRDDAAVQRLALHLADLHRLPLPLAEGERQELAPRCLTLEPDAKRAWVALHDAVEAAMAPAGRYACTTVKAFASKTPEQAFRIAGVLTLLENPDAQTITAETIGRASELALWHLNEAARLVGTAELSQETRDAEALLTWFHETGRELIHSREALRYGPNRIRERTRFTRAMQELERAGWAEFIQGGAEVDGARRRNVWRVAGAE